MKKHLYVFALLVMSTFTTQAQGLKEAPANKAVVYFLRPSGFGGLINFSFFDSAQVIGRFNGEKYMVYECAPGQHIFWARSENKSFISGNLEAGKIYFIEARPQLGGVKAGVELAQVDPTDTKRMERMLKFINKRKPRTFTTEELTELGSELDDVLRRGMEELQSKRSNGESISVIDNSKHISIPPPANQ